MNIKTESWKQFYIVKLKNLLMNLFYQHRQLTYFLFCLHGNTQRECCRSENILMLRYVFHTTCSYEGSDCCRKINNLRRLRTFSAISDAANGLSKSDCVSYTDRPLRRTRVFFLGRIIFNTKMQLYIL